MRLAILSGVKIQKPEFIMGNLYIKNKGRLQIGSGLKINSGRTNNPIGGDIICRLVTKPGSLLKIGNNVGISNSTIYCAQKITIGNNVVIGGSCKIWDTDFHPINKYLRNENNVENIKTKEIIINDDVWIGAGTTILKGVEIGQGSIIGAGSVVTKDVKHNEIWAGNPAKFVRKIID